VEKNIIGAIINKPDSLVDIIGKIQPDDFDDKSAGVAFHGLCEMWESEKHIDLVTIITHLGGSADPVWFAEATSLFTSSSGVLAYVDEVIEKATAKRVTRLIAETLNESIDSRDMLSKIATIYDSESGAKSKDSSISSAMKRFDRSVEYAKKHGFGVDTGLSIFERCQIRYTPSHIWVMGGFTSVGKTATLTEMISRIDKTVHKVAVISTEMTTDQMIGRILANKTGFASNVIMSGNLYGRNAPRLDSAKKILASENLHIFDDVHEISAIETSLIKLSLQGGIDVVFLDYLQNCSVDGAKSEYQEMSILAKRLQKLAKKIKATIICLSQVSNSAAKDDNGILQFKGAGEFSAVADVGIMLKKGKEDTSHVLLDVAKHRHGKKGKQVLRYMDGWTRLEEFDHVDNE